MEERYLIGLTGILAIGMAARWIAWRFKLPSILLLLISGLIAGPGTGLLNPDAVFGDLLFPLVSIAVALILFEGGLSLDLRELREIGGLVRNLITIGALTTWLLASFGAWLILALDAELSLLMGAILVVTGPTVVIPLLRHVRPTGRVRNTLKWEGILIDPVGAILAVLVFEAILSGGMIGVVRDAGAFVYALLAGAAAGLIGAAVMVLFLRLHWIPDFLENLFSLTMAVGVFAVSNEFHHESGLLAVTVMGVALANQRIIAVRGIVEFKEHLRVLMLTSLFVILSARLEAEAIREVLWPSLGYLAMLLFIARPATVWISSLGSELSSRERLFLSWMAPRGIVAAAVASIFSERLAATGRPGAEQLVPITFIIIIGTVAIYSLTAFPLARKLKLAEPSPQGVLFLGAHRWAQEMAKALKKLDFHVALVDSHWPNITAARQEGLPAHFGNVFSQKVLDDVNLFGIGRLLAITSNNEANSLAAVHFAAAFGRKEVYQLPIDAGSGESRRTIGPLHLQGWPLFSKTSTFDRLDRLFTDGGAVKTTPISEKFTFESFKKRYGEDFIPLFVVTKDRELIIAGAENPVKPRAGQTLIAVVAREVSEDRERDEPAVAQAS